MPKKHHLPDCARFYRDPAAYGPIGPLNRDHVIGNDIANAGDMADTIICVPLDYMEVIIDPRENTDSYAYIRLRRKLTPELERFRRRNGFKVAA